MNTEPTSWKEIMNAPEIPNNYEGKIVKNVEYSTKYHEPKISFIPVLYETKLENEGSKWYISNSTASCLQACGDRNSCEMPIESVKISDCFYFYYNYDDTKRYAEWYFAKKGAFIVQKGRQYKYHFILLFFCEDENWAPFHHDLMYMRFKNVILLKPTSFSVTEITKKLLGQEDIETNEEDYTKEEIGFIRILIALMAYRPEFRKSNDYKKFVSDQLSEYIKWTGFEISFDSFILKADFIQFNKLSLIKSPCLFPFIYRYFFSLNNLEGSFVRKSLKKYQTVSFFNIIYRFLRMKDKRLIHFDENILSEVRFYVTILEKQAGLLRDRLPYSDLLTKNYEVNAKNWKMLAAMAYWHRMEELSAIPPEDHAKLVNKLKTLIPDLDEKMKTPSNEGKNEIYKQFEEMEEVHEIMKNIPWDQYKLEPKYANFLCFQFVDDRFY